MAIVTIKITGYFTCDGGMDIAPSISFQADTATELSAKPINEIVRTFYAGFLNDIKSMPSVTGVREMTAAEIAEYKRDNEDE